jgi:hypothetical protein
MLGLHVTRRTRRARARGIAVFHGNCQAEALRKVLEHSPSFCARYEVVETPHVHVLAAKARNPDDPALAEFVETVSRASLVLSQLVRSDYHGAPVGTDQVRELLSDRAQLLTFPQLHYEGLFPYHVYVSIDGEHFGADAPLVIYHDLRFIQCAAKGYDAATAGRWLERYEPPLDTIREHAAYQRKILIAIQDRVDVQLTDSLLDDRAFLTIDHPSNATMFEVSAGVHAALGLPQQPFRLLPEVLGNIRMPIEQPALRALGIEAQARPSWFVRGAEHSLAAVLELHLGFYRERPEVLEAGLSEHAERMQALDLSSY